MALERLIGEVGLDAMDESEGVSSTNRQLGWNFKTSAAGKVVAGGWVRMNSAGTWVSGTKWQLWKRETPISASTLIQSIEIGGGIVTGLPDEEQPVPGVAATALVQNDFYFVTIFIPSTQTGNYNYQSGFGNPSGATLSGNCIYKNGGTVSQPPDDETFTNGGFGVDIGIDDAGDPPISATLTIVLPAIELATEADAIASATLALVLPAVSAAAEADAIASATLAIVLPALSLEATAQAVVNGTLAITLPPLEASAGADADINATLNISLPVPVVEADGAAVANAILNVVLPAVQMSLVSADASLAANLREYVWGLLSADASMNALAINSASLFGTNAPDSPAANLAVWAVINWGIEEAPLGRDTDVRRRFVSIWAYDRERRYDRIEAILGRARSLLYPLKAVNYASGGWIVEVTENGTSEDLWDDAYNAATKNWQLTIVASGT